MKKIKRFMVTAYTDGSFKVSDLENNCKNVFEGTTAECYAWIQLIENGYLEI